MKDLTIAMEMVEEEALDIIKKRYEVSDSEANELAELIAIAYTNEGSNKRHASKLMDRIGIEREHVYAILRDERAFDELRLDRSV